MVQFYKMTKHLTPHYLRASKRKIKKLTRFIITFCYVDYMLTRFNITFCYVDYTLTRFNITFCYVDYIPSMNNLKFDDYVDSIYLIVIKIKDTTGTAR
jgi:hypothetical protein